MQIVEFQLSDYEETVKLWKLSGLIMRPGDDIEGIKVKLQRDPDIFLVAKDAGEIVGVVMGAWDGRRGWVNHVAVKADHRRKGIARALITELEKKLIQKGATKVNAQIYRSNTKSLEFFKSAGYEVQPDLVMVGKYLRK